MIFTEAEAEVNITYLGMIDPYINRNESQQLFYYMKLLLMPSESCFINWPLLQDAFYAIISASKCDIRLYYTTKNISFI
jgi:hypothetical protein